MKYLAKYFFLISIICISSTVFATGSQASPELVVHLLDYLAKDYGSAVQGGKVVSKSEYDEQIEFAAIVGKNSQEAEKLKSDSTFQAEVRSLQNLIKSMAAPDQVAALARKLQQDTIRLAQIDVAPRAVPDLEMGAKLFQTSCVTCHGNTGHGDGPAGKALDPRPANFHQAELVWNSAPYKFFNTIRLGVPGTGMAAFSGLSDQEVWALAFYVKSLPFQHLTTGGMPPSISLKDAASLTDSEIAVRLGGETEENKASIASLRAIGFVSEGGNPLGTAERFLNESVAAAKANDFAKANERALRAYLEGIEPLEPKMKANLPGFVEEVEGLMSNFRASIERRENVSKIEAQKTEILGKLKEVKKLFSETRMSPGVAFGAAFSIFLREGFEAILIITILLSILRAMDQPQAVRWVHAGWISAIAVGIVTWFASGLLLSMSGLSRELLEGGISLLAVAVLVYVGFWLHRYAEMKKWRAFLEAKLKHGLNKGSYFALGAVAFMAVFREAFEVVLFLRAIWIDLDSSGQAVAGIGILSSIGLLMVLSYFAIKESRKLPLGILFQVCSWTMMALAIVLIGKGIHSLQEAGLIGIEPFELPIRIDLLGIYPSAQTLGAQSILIFLFAFLLIRDRVRTIS